PALVHVEELAADGAPVDAAGASSIPSRRHRITLGFAGLSLAVPERMRFRYRLDGFDRDWSEPSQARQAVYTNLAPRPYRLHVIASHSDGAGDGREATTAFASAPADR